MIRRPGRLPLLASLSLVALAAAGLGSAPAVAQESRYYREGRHLVHEITGVIPSGASIVQVDTDLGSVDLQGSQASDVRYRIRVKTVGGDDTEVRKRLDDLVVSARKSGRVLLFKGEAARALAEPGLVAEFALTLPGDTPQIEVRTGAGDVTARALKGAATLVTQGGRITADRVSGPLRAETRGGPIDIGHVDGSARLATQGGGVTVGSAGGAVVAQTSGGEVRIGAAGGEVKAETGGGEIRIESASGNVDVRTGGGNIELGRIGGTVSAATTGGSIRVASSRGALRCETGAGSISLRGVGGPVHAVTSAGDILADLAEAAGPFSDSDLQAWQGDITILLPDRLPLTVRALIDNPAGSRIRTDFPLRIGRETEEAGRSAEIAEGSIAGGGPLLKVRSLGGNISIRKSEANAADGSASSRR
jgi:DUF4097 and DUF4098 domain-containing protein YvlB